MRIFKIKSIPVDKVIVELANAMEAEVTNECDEYILKIPAELGKGYIKGATFEKGLGFVHYNCTFYEDVQINFLRNRIHPLKFIYTLKGNLTLQFEDDNHDKHLEQFQYCVLASKSDIGHKLKFSKDANLDFNSLEVDRDKYYSDMSCSIDKMKGKLKDLFQDIHAEKAFYHNSFYSLEIADLLLQIKDYEGEPAFRKIFLEGLANQILLREITQFAFEMSDENGHSLLQKHEIRSIEEANTIITIEITDLPTIKQLAYRVGLNSNKLQEGFKRMFNCTINTHVRNKRLEISKNLLITTNLSMNEICDKIGISSKSYFSKLFKEVYGVSPSHFRTTNSR